MLFLTLNIAKCTHLDYFSLVHFEILVNLILELYIGPSCTLILARAHDNGWWGVFPGIYKRGPTISLEHMIMVGGGISWNIQAWTYYFYGLIKNPHSILHEWLMPGMRWCLVWWIGQSTW